MPAQLRRPQSQTLQFDVRLKTFTQEGEGYLLCVKLAGAAAETLWLIPAKDLATIARQSPTHLIMVPSAKPSSKDRFSPYRMTHFGEVTAKILARTSVQK